MLLLLCAALFEPNGAFEAQLKYLEKLHPGTDPYFKTGKPLAGGIAIITTIDMAVHLHPTILDSFPKLKAAHAAFLKSEIYSTFDEFSYYFNR